MKINKNKQNNPSLQRFFIILWIASIFSFIFTIDTSNNGKIFPTFLTILFLGNILAGIVVFLLAIFSKKLFKTLDKAKFITHTPLIAFAYFLIYVTAMTANGHGLIASQIDIKTSSEVIKSTNTPPPSENPTPTPTYTPTPTTKPVKPVYVDPDPIVDCNFTYNGVKKIKKSECSKSFECQIADKWYLYTSHDKCTQDQATYWKEYYSSKGNKYNPSTTNSNWDPNKEYTNCTVADINTNQLQHFYITYSECSKRQNEALAKFTDAGKKSLEEGQQKLKDQEAASQYQEALNKACTQVQSEWFDYKVEFYATEYNNFSSSAEAVRELSRRRDSYQSQANNAGCNIYLSM